MRRSVSDIKKFEKRDLAQAVVNAAYLVACADRKRETSEKAKIDQVLGTPSYFWRLSHLKSTLSAPRSPASWIPTSKLAAGLLFMILKT